MSGVLAQAHQSLLDLTCNELVIFSLVVVDLSCGLARQWNPLKAYGVLRL